MNLESNDNKTDAAAGYWETMDDSYNELNPNFKKNKMNNMINSIELDTEEELLLSHKSFKERALELMKKIESSPNCHLITRTLNCNDWLYIHRIIRKSKGLKSKFMIRNLTPYLFNPSCVLQWKCKLCCENIQSPIQNYINHMKIIHGMDPEDNEPEFPCDICGEYIKHGKYVIHWVPHFMEHECPICKKTFALNCHMKYHYKVVHEENEQTCSQCGKLIKNDLALRRHIRLFHGNRSNWRICDICGKRVKFRCLEPHKLTHSQERPYKCEICKKCFKTPSTLYQHQKVHTNDSKAHKYLCEYCGKRKCMYCKNLYRFKHHTSWNLHVVRIHEGEYEHKCPVCFKRFHKLFELKKHSVKHSEERPFPCSICGKFFKTKTHLKEHITIHSDEKAHICPLCGKQIRMKANLYKHLKVHKNRGEIIPPLKIKSNIIKKTEDIIIPLDTNSNTFLSSGSICLEENFITPIANQNGDNEFIIIDNAQLLQSTNETISMVKLPYQDDQLNKEFLNSSEFHTIFVSNMDGYLIPTNMAEAQSTQVSDIMVPIIDENNESFHVSMESAPSTVTIVVNHHHHHYSAEQYQRDAQQ